MKKILKVFVSTVLIFALCLGLAACGGSGKTNKKAEGQGGVKILEGESAKPTGKSGGSAGAGSEASGSSGSGSSGSAQSGSAGSEGANGSGSAGAGPTENSGNGADPGTELPNNGGTEVTKALIARAAEMQDYSHAPGEDAKPINTVDDNLLLLVNKTHPLGKDYWPEDLVTVSRTVDGVGNSDTKKMRKVAAEAVEKMMADALEQGIDIRVRTGFRSYDYQTNLFNSYASKNGEAEANKFSARPGESEHQTGYACDLGGKTEGYALSYQFGNTAEGKWVYEHCSEYGFILRFIDGKTVNGVREPGEITGYVYEPWHIRYVGVDAATEIYERGICLEEYLGILD